MFNGMATEPEIDDVLGECFEPREESGSFSDVTLQLDKDSTPAETSALSVIVCDPEKFSSFLETYLRYRVRTQSSREEYGSGQHDVFRRYNDFLWLRDRLEEIHPTIVIPPFPPKHSVSTFERFSGPFISVRCAALQRFLSRVCEHAQLSSSNDLFNFLTMADQEEWVRYKQTFKPTAQWVSRIKDFVQAGEKTPEFEDCLAKLEICAEGCERLAGTARRLMTEEQALTKETASYAGALCSWSVECGNVAKVGNILFHLQQAFDAQASDLLPTTLCLQSGFIPDTLDVIAFADCVRKIVIRRDKLQGLIRDTNDSAAKLEENLDQPGVIARRVWRQTPEAERQNKEEKLNHLRARSNSLSGTLEMANSDLSSEWQLWKRQRTNLLRRALVELAGQRIAHYRRMQQLWAETSRSVEDVLACH